MAEFAMHLPVWFVNNQWHQAFLFGRMRIMTPAAIGIGHVVPLVRGKELVISRIMARRAQDA